MTTPLPPSDTAIPTAEVRAQLRAIEFLDGLTDGDYHLLAQRVERIAVEPGTYLFPQGDTRTRLCFLARGSVAIEKNAGADAPTMRLATLGAGDAIGEGLLLDESAHGTSAVALESIEGYAL